MISLDDVYAALELADWTLRYEHPEYFVRVDELKAQPGWVAFEHQRPFPFSTPRLRECAWCGDFFPRQGYLVTCTPTCSREYRAWKGRRRRIGA